MNSAAPVGIGWNVGLAVTPKRRHGNTIKERTMYELNIVDTALDPCATVKFSL